MVFLGKTKLVKSLSSNLHFPTHKMIWDAAEKGPPPSPLLEYGNAAATIRLGLSDHNLRPEREKGEGIRFLWEIVRGEEFRRRRRLCLYGKPWKHFCETAVDFAEKIRLFSEFHMRNSCVHVCVTNQPACQRGLSSWFFLNKLHGKWECVLAAPNNCRFSLCSDCCKSTYAGQFVRKKEGKGRGGLSNLFSIPLLFFFLLCEAFLLLLSALHTELLRVVATLLLSKFVNLVCSFPPLPFLPSFLPCLFTNTPMLQPASSNQVSTSEHSP